MKVNNIRIAISGQFDSNNERFAKHALKKCNGMKIKMYENFVSSKSLGIASTKFIDGSLFMETELDEKYLNYYPVIGGKIISASRMTEGGRRVIYDFKLTMIGICKRPNTETNIKSIGDQIKQMNDGR